MKIKKRKKTVKMKLFLIIIQIISFVNIAKGDSPQVFFFKYFSFSKEIDLFFFLEVAERHIENCKNIFHRPKPPNFSHLEKNQTKNELLLSKKPEIFTKYSTTLKSILFFKANMI